eukprot:7347754-Ditylum_brightwellii.AAC.1
MGNNWCTNPRSHHDEEAQPRNDTMRPESLKAKYGPPNDCDGYFPPMTPTLVRNGTVEEINFYISSCPSNERAGNTTRDIACTLTSTP